MGSGWRVCTPKIFRTRRWKAGLRRTLLTGDVDGLFGQSSPLDASTLVDWIEERSTFWTPDHDPSLECSPCILICGKPSVFSVVRIADGELARSKIVVCEFEADRFRTPKIGSREQGQ